MWTVGLSTGQVGPDADESFESFVKALGEPPKWTRLDRTERELREILGVA